MIAIRFKKNLPNLVKIESGCERLQKKTEEHYQNSQGKKWKFEISYTLCTEQVYRKGGILKLKKMKSA